LSIVGGIIGGMLLGERAAIKKKFKKLNALSESTAVTLEELKLEKREISMFETLLKKGQIKKTTDGRYYWAAKDC
jgi:hypothetical protein